MLRFDANGLEYGVMAVYFAVVPGIGIPAQLTEDTRLPQRPRVSGHGASSPRTRGAH